MSVVFFLKSEKAKFKTIAMRAATIIAVKMSEKNGWVVYFGENPNCKIKLDMFIIR
jgi:hypothetical protein